MRYLSLLLAVLLLNGCNTCGEYDSNGNYVVLNDDGTLVLENTQTTYPGEAGNVAYIYEDEIIAPANNSYATLKDGDIIHVAGFDIEKGQYITDFFDDFDVPMHAQYINYFTIRWTYYVNSDGKIVRWCDLKKYGPKSLCALVVDFDNKKVARAYTNCK